MPITVSSEDLQITKLIASLDKLHSAPTIALRVMQLTRDEDYEMNEVAKCLENDPALAALILRLINSSYYGLVDGVTSLPHALTYLGRKSLRLAVLSFGLVKSMVNGAPAQFHQMYWKRSLTMAAAARECANLIKSPDVDPDTAYAAGLLSDLGMLVLAQAKTKEYVDISSAPDHIIDLVMQERKSMTFDHMSVGAHLLKSWEMPTDVIESVANHHTYLPLSPKIQHTLLAANLLTEALWVPASPYMQPLRLVANNHLHLDVDDIITLAVNTKEAVLESMKIFNVKIKDEINLESIENEARQIYAEAAKSSTEDDEFMIALMNL